MKRILYEFYDGHKEYVEVEDEVAEAYEQMLAEEERLERKETRRHQSLEVMMDAGMDFEDPTASIDYILEKREQEAREMRLIKSYRSHVKSLYKRLKKYIPKRQAQAYLLYTQMYLKKVEIAKVMGITEGAVRKLLLKAKANIKKLKCRQQEIRKLPHIPPQPESGANARK